MLQHIYAAVRFCSAAVMFKSRILHRIFEGENGSSEPWGTTFTIENLSESVTVPSPPNTVSNANKLWQIEFREAIGNRIPTSYGYPSIAALGTLEPNGLR